MSSSTWYNTLQFYWNVLICAPQLCIRRKIEWHFLTLDKAVYMQKTIYTFGKIILGTFIHAYPPKTMNWMLLKASALCFLYA